MIKPIYNCIIFSTIFLLIILSRANAQSLYFQRQISIPSADGFFSTLPTSGPASSLTNILNSISNTASAGVVYDSDGIFYISDVDNNRILKVNKNGGQEIAVSEAASIMAPRGLALDRSNKLLYIMDRNTQQIWRANLNNALPITAVDIITSDNLFTGNMVDIHFNNTDGKLYWTNNGQLHRAAAGLSVSLPVTPQQINLSVAQSIRAFGFDNASPQQIYFSNPSTMTKGVYRSDVPDVNTSTLTDSLVFDLTGEPGLSIAGMSLDAQSNTLCYSGNQSTQSFIRCGDRNNFALFTQILLDTGDFSVLGEPPVFMAIEPAAIVPTPTPSPTGTPRVVTPGIVPLAPAITVNTEAKKPSATIQLELYSGADTKKSSQSLIAFLLNDARKKAGNSAKIGFQYRVEIKREGDADGTPLKGSKDKDIRSILSKRNILTVKNLKANSNYSVKYRVEITSKSKGSGLKIVKKTPLSPTAEFIIN